MEEQGTRAGAGRVAAILTALVLGLAACSSGSDSGSGSGSDGGSEPETQVETAESATAEADTAEADTVESQSDTESDVDCEPLFFNRGDYSTVAGGFTRSTTQAEAEEQQQRFTPAEMREIVEIYRPYQDVEGEVFGTLREGLDNLSIDIDAFEAGTFAGPTGESYKTASIAPVLQAIGC